MKKAILHAISICPEGTLHEDDRELAGKYSVTLADDIEPENAADVTLDYFHSNIPVKCLDDFEFKVMSEEGEELTIEPDHESYSAEHLATSIEKL